MRKLQSRNEHITQVHHNLCSILMNTVMQIGDDFYEDLTPETTLKIVDALAKGEKPKPGPQSGRFTSENSAGLTTLTGTVSLHFCSTAVNFLTPSLIIAMARDEAGSQEVGADVQPYGPGAHCLPEFQ